MKSMTAQRTLRNLAHFWRSRWPITIIYTGRRLVERERVRDRKRDDYIKWRKEQERTGNSQLVKCNCH